MAQTTDHMQTAQTQTQLRLLDAAIAEFSEHGYYSTNVDSITKRAGVSHGTFYQYFKNKNDIIRTLIQNLMKMLPGIWEDMVPNIDIKNIVITPELLSYFENVMTMVIELLEKSSGLLKAFAQGILQDEEAFVLSKNFALDSSSIFKIMLNTVQRNRRHESCNTDVLAQLIFIAVFTAILVRTMNIISVSPEILVKNITAIIYPSLLYEMDRRDGMIEKRAMNEKDTKTRYDLIRAAEEVLSVKGYIDTTVADIAKRAGYSRGTFYLYFTDKDDIIEAIFNKIRSTVNQFNVTSLGLTKSWDTSSLEEITKFCYQIVDMFDQPFNRAILQGAVCSERISTLCQQSLAFFSTPLASRIATQRELGLCPDVDPAVAAQIIIAFLGASTYLWNVGAIECTKDEYAVNMAWLLFYFFNY